MKLLLIAAICVSWILPASNALGQQECIASFRPAAEVGRQGFFFADLLASSVCPEIRRVAVGMRLGASPAAGSVRVLSAEVIRSQWIELQSRAGEAAASWRISNIPARIVIRRAGPRASCRELAARVGFEPLADPPSGASEAAAQSAEPETTELECGAEGRIPRDAAVEAVAEFWDAALARWQISARCVRSEDCVPFLIQTKMQASAADSAAPVAGPAQPSIFPPSHALQPTKADRASSQPMVHRGQNVTLLWERNGIRVVVPAVCLAPGNSGDLVDARIVSSGVTVRASVVSQQILHAAP